MTQELHERLHNVVSETGLWNGGAGNRAFLLSPSVYELTADKATELALLGQSIKSCFAGLNGMAAEVSNPKNGHSRAWRIARAAFTNGVSKLYGNLQRTNPHHEPLITKVDLMEDRQGNYLIAEIDGYNPRGMGYSTLASYLAGTVSDQPRLPGVAACLARELLAEGVDMVTFLYADNERFYLPEFTIFQKEMANHGVQVILASEMDDLVHPLTEYYVVLPQLNRKPALGSQLAQLYLEDKVFFLIPPKPYLGSKSVLALLKNEDGVEELENLLCSYIPLPELERVRRHIPETYLVGKNPLKLSARGVRNSLGLTLWEEALASAPGEFVLKRSISSGMKGVFFADDHQYETALAEAGNAQGCFVLQREVEQLDRCFSCFTPEGTAITHDNWHTRVTAHYIAGNLADIVVTARRDKRVHGSTDCLQLGTVLV